MLGESGMRDSFFARGQESGVCGVSSVTRKELVRTGFFLGYRFLGRYWKSLGEYF